MAQSERSTTLEFQPLAFLPGTRTDRVALSTASWRGAAVAVGGAGIRCLNEECSRRADVGERYCAACDLDRELFWRDARRREAAAPSKRQPIR